MLLRRVIEHVKHQNWTAVALDFLIVVVGVFIGIQVANWNDAREARTTGEFYLARIGEDIASDADFLERNLVNLEREAEHAGLISRYLKDGNAGAMSDWEMFQIIYYRAGWTPFSPNRVTYDELISSGQFALLGDAALRKDIGDYYAALADMSGFYEFQPPLRELIRSKYSPEVQAYMWESCFPDAHYRSDERAWSRCAPPEDMDEVADTLEALRNTDDLLGAIQYVHSIRLVVIGAVHTDIARARALSAKIKDALG